VAGDGLAGRKKTRAAAVGSLGIIGTIFAYKYFFRRFRRRRWISRDAAGGAEGGRTLWLGGREG